MAVITELPAEGVGNPGDVGPDRQIQPMEHEIRDNESGNDSGRGIGRVSWHFSIDKYPIKKEEPEFWTMETPLDRFMSFLMKKFLDRIPPSIFF